MGELLPPPGPPEVDAGRLAEAMGGTVGVASSPGRGSTFWFDLPVHGHA